MLREIKGITEDMINKLKINKMMNKKGELRGVSGYLTFLFLLALVVGGIVNLVGMATGNKQINYIGLGFWVAAAVFYIWARMLSNF